MSQLDYSESFESDLTSLSGSDEESGVLSELKNNLDTCPDSPIHTPQQKFNDNVKNTPIFKNSGVDLSRTVRSPEMMAQHLTECRAREKPGHPPPSSNSPNKPLKFKEVAGKVQSMQSAAKGFKNSHEIRDITFKDWAAKKEVKGIKDRNSQIQQRKIEEEKRKKKELEASLRSVEKIEKWRESKEALLKTKKILESEEEKHKIKDLEEKEAKLLEGKKATEQWRENSKKHFLKKQREKAKTEKEEENKRKDEKMKRDVESKKSLDHWIQAKEKEMREKQKRKKMEAKELELTKKQEVVERQVNSKKAYEAWKANKDGGKTGTYKKPEKRIHIKAWCPARSIKYDYPKNNDINLKKSTGEIKSLDSTGSIVDSYSNASFELSSPESKDISSNSSVSSIQESVNRSSSPKGRLKTIQVCCKSIEYWCTCEEEQDTP